MTEPNKYSLTTWGQQDVQDVTTPSGQLCQVRKLQMEDIVELGLLDKIDSLGVTVQEEAIDPIRNPRDHQKRKATKAEQAESEAKQTRELLQDKQKFTDMVSTIDTIVCAVVVQPPVRNASGADGKRIPHSEREQGIVYSDSIDIEDKIYLFDYCFGGIKKLEQFREESSEDVGSVAEQSGDAQSSERDHGAEQPVTGQLF